MFNLQNLTKIITVRSAMTDANGTFVTVTARTKDGKITKHNGRTGVTKHTKGGTVAKLGLTGFVLYSPSKGGYRTVPYSSVISISYNNRTQVFEGKAV